MTAIEAATVDVLALFGRTLDKMNVAPVRRCGVQPHTYRGRGMQPQ